MSLSASSVPTNACRSAVDLNSAVSHGAPSCQTKSVLLTRRRPEETLRPVSGAFMPGSVLWRVEPTAVWAQLVELDPEMAMALLQPRSTLVRSGRSTRHDRTWASRDNWRISSRSVRQPALRFHSCEPRNKAVTRALRYQGAATLGDIRWRGIVIMAAAVCSVEIVGSGESGLRHSSVRRPAAGEMLRPFPGERMSGRWLVMRFCGGSSRPFPSRRRRSRACRRAGRAGCWSAAGR